MAKGTIEKYDSNRKSGFIEDATGEKYYFRAEQVSSQSLENLEPGCSVEFEVRPAAPGASYPQAVRIRINDQVSPQKNQTLTPPYHFVPIPVSDDKVQSVTDSPVFHDGVNPNKETLFSGELRCSLTALTPLLVGNDQYPKQENCDGNIEAWLKKNDAEKDKQVLEPLRLPDGRVLIAGSSLKGMLRQSLGALLAAPMERVGERTYSYRPNMIFTDNSKNRYLEGMPAIVEHEPDKNGDGMKIKFAAKAIGKQTKTWSQGSGIDGAGELANLAGKKRPKNQAKIQNIASRAIPVPREVVLHFQETLLHLRDTNCGHISERHPDIKEREQRTQVAKNIKKLQEDALKPGQVIYVERKKQDQQITSIGTHELFRLRYADTVRTRFKGYAQERGESGGYFVMEPRPILAPLKEEQISEAERSSLTPNIPPKKLSGARLLFGYVSDNSGKNASGSWGIGKGDFEKLAGRIAFNIAVEQTADHNNDTRFLNPDNGCAVPLKVLGGPRPSAVEYYLDQSEIKKRQDGGTLITYGDLPGIDPPGELRGRKFYLNQPSAEKETSCFEETSADIKKSKLATLARFVSKPGSKFLFKLRFRDLRPWELGTVLLALQPDNVEKLPDLPDAIMYHLKRLENLTGENKFALKLGHGRPLGMGSVKIGIDDLILLEPAQADTKKLLEIAFKELSTRIRPLADKVVLQWLKVQQYAGRTKASYPQKDGTIYDFHTNIRSAHAKARRYPGRPSPESNALKKDLS